MERYGRKAMLVAKLKCCVRNNLIFGLMIQSACLMSVATFDQRLCSAQTPVTYERIMELLDLEVKEERILKLLENSDTQFTLGADQVKALKSKGASDTLIETLQKKNNTTAQQIPSASSDVSDFVLILDCSGSMKDATTDGKTKWDVARSAALDLITAIPNGKQLAFIVYGHSQALGCEAVEVVRPLAPMSDNSRQALTSIVKNLQPVGNTPIALALERAANELEFASGLSKVVLITDGIETCKGDPVAAAKKLALSQNLKGGVNVIGFALKAEESQAISLIAKEGNGSYFDAKDAAEFVRTVKLVESTITKAATSNVHVVKSEVKPSKDQNNPAEIEMGKYISGRLASGKGHYLSINVPAGEYVAICEFKRSDDEDSNIQFNVRLDGSPLIHVNEIDRIERGAAKFHSDGGSHLVSIENNNDICDYNFVVYSATDELPLPFIEVPNLAFQDLKLGQVASVSLKPKALDARDAYFRLTLEEGDYEVAFNLSSPDATGNFGAVMDSMNPLGVKIERLGSSYDSAKSQAIKLKVIVADEQVMYVRLRNKNADTVQGSFSVTPVKANAR